MDGLHHDFYGRDRVSYKLESGNTSYELAWGLAGIVHYLRTRGRHRRLRRV